MNWTVRFKCFLALVLICYFGTSKSSDIVDSLNKVIATTENDSIRVYCMIKVSKKFWYLNTDTAALLAKLARDEAVAQGFPIQEANAYNAIGVASYRGGEYNSAVPALERAISLFSKYENREGLAVALSNLGTSYLYLTNYPKALDYLMQSQRIDIELGNKDGYSDSYITVGAIHRYQGDIDKGIEFYKKALKIKEELHSQRGLFFCYQGLGALYSAKGDQRQSLEYNDRALAIAEELGRKSSVSMVLNNMGSCYYKLGNYSLARAYYSRSLIINEETGNDFGISMTLYNIARSDFEKNTAKGPHLQAVLDSFAYRSYQIAKHIESLARIQSSSGLISEIYAAQGDFVNALLFYKEYTGIKDSIYNEDKSKEIGRLEAGYEFERADEDRRRAEEEQFTAIQGEERRRNNLQYSLILIAIVGLAMILFAFGRFDIPVRIVEGFTFFTFLLFFEFCLVLLDPYIEEWSGGAPAFKLLFNALLAGAIFPLHAFFENKLKSRIT